MTYDDLLNKIGDFGTYQKRIYFFLCLPAISCAVHKLAGVVILAKPNYRYSTCIHILLYYIIFLYNFIVVIIITIIIP